MPGGSVSVMNLGEMFGKAFQRRQEDPQGDRLRRPRAVDGRGGDKLLDQEQVAAETVRAVEENGIVFLDEIGKICARDGRASADIPRGACSAICCADRGDDSLDKYGPVKTDHVLFIASGAFHITTRPISCPNSRAVCRSASEQARSGTRADPDGDQG